MASPDAWSKTLVTATGLVAGTGKGVELGGFILSVAGTSTTITAYDALSATGNPVIPTTAALTVGQYVPPTGLALNTTLPANGIRLETGLYVTVGGTGSPQIYALWR